MKEDFIKELNKYLNNEESRFLEMLPALISNEESVARHNFVTGGITTIRFIRQFIIETLESMEQ